ncbi:SIS domain-containing protein [Alkalibacterium kapii]|uniref:SIS domain-containing protein n=1 Tax=Alkalibacterium kapii TaxID=426704 RepID=A0A511AWH4_9LACT|nr:SIS domain-containing protein [Alkalibacterium kapii]GEK92002.1 hypothetical protein AKA01nite_16240 [Alkalibacterium kapii]
MKHLEYFQKIEEQLKEQLKEEHIEQAAQFCAESIRAGRLVHVFGSGYSQMMAMEVFYRAGGIVPINALLLPQYALFPHAELSTHQERDENFSNHYLHMEDIDEKDTMIVASVSGRNAGVIDMALEAKNVGMHVVALTSLAFSQTISSRHSSGKLLKDVADVVIDIKCDAGDVAMSLERIDSKFAATSKVLGLTVMESIIARTIEINKEHQFDTPIFSSSNLNDGDKINAKHIKNIDRCYLIYDLLE